MTNVLRRTVLFSAATGAASVLFSTKASAVEKQYDPDIFAIEARMMRLSNRGSSLTESEKYGVLLATCSAQGLRDEAAEITAEALIAGVKPLVLLLRLSDSSLCWAWAYEGGFDWGERSV